MNYLMPKHGVLSMHCSATADKHDGPLVAPLRPVGHRQDHALGRSQAAADRRRRALLERRRHLQHRRRLLRQGHRPDARVSEPDIFQALRFGAVLENVVLRRRPHSVDFDDTQHHREHARRLPDRVHPQRQDPLRRRPSDRHHLSDLRRLRRAAAGEPLDAGAGDVSLHQRLHGQGRRHRGGRDRAAGHVLALLRRAVPRLASDASTPSCWPTRCSSTTRASGWSTPAGAAAPTASGKRIKLAHTRAIVDAIHSGSAGECQDRSAIPVFGFDVITRVSRRSRGDA